jgi:predicted MFS family arabinose efflux permease
VILGLAQINPIDGLSVTSPSVIIPVLLGLIALWLFARHSLRAKYALIDLRLFKDRIFGACSGTLFIGLIAVFGGLLLLPLYLQTIRGESPSSTGLLLAPQGLGAVIALPIAGWLADRVPIGRIVPVGLALIALPFYALSDITPHTSYAYFAVTVFVMGAGMGVTMVPMFSGAMKTLTKPQVARASTAINIIQQSGAAIGTVLLSIILSEILANKSYPGLSATASLGKLEPVKAAVISDAYGTTFAFAAGLTVVALIVALIFLPIRRPAVEPTAEPDAEVSVVV